MPRCAIVLSLALLLGGCVVSTEHDPLSSREGRQAAVQAYVQLGLGYLQQGQGERAREPLRQALALDPDSAEAHAALALAFQLEGEAALAEQHYRQALSLQRSARLLNNYAGFLYQRQRYAEAARLFAEAAADPLYAERSRVFESLGLTALRLERPAEAREHFARSLRLDARQPGVLLEIAELAYAARDYDAARGYYERLVALDERPSARRLLLAARLARLFEDEGKAAGYARQLQQRYPDSPEHLHYLSEQP